VHDSEDEARHAREAPSRQHDGLQSRTDDADGEHHPRRLRTARVGESTDTSHGTGQLPVGSASSLSIPGRSDPVRDRAGGIGRGRGGIRTLTPTFAEVLVRRRFRRSVAYSCWTDANRW
jgi:hypothetical protein